MFWILVYAVVTLVLLIFWVDPVYEALMEKTYEEEPDQPMLMACAIIALCCAALWPIALPLSIWVNWKAQGVSKYEDS